MLRVVLPGVAVAPVNGLSVVDVLPVIIRVLYEIVVVVDINIIVSSPSSIPTATPSPSCAHCNADAE
jgi:hypothetical protein